MQFTWSGVVVVYVLPLLTTVTQRPLISFSPPVSVVSHVMKESLTPPSSPIRQGKAPTNTLTLFQLSSVPEYLMQMRVPPRRLEMTGRTVEEGNWEIDRIVNLLYLLSSLSFFPAWTRFGKRMRKMKYNNIFNILAIKYIIKLH